MRGSIKQYRILKSKAIYFIIVLSISFLPVGRLAAQVLTDSLDKDSTNHSLRVKLNTKDSASKFVPLSKISSSDITDTILEPKKIPGKAGMYSALLPGLGQAYNGNYWKIPIIYSLFATIFFIGEDNNNKFQIFKKAYDVYDEEGIIPGLNPNYTKDDLKEYKDYYKRNRDFNIIIGVAVYFLNILDASVDAHLMNYDIGEDLSLKISPEMDTYGLYEKYPLKTGFGLKFVLSFR